MKPKEAKTELEKLIRQSGTPKSDLTPAQGIRLMLDFYRDVRADGCKFDEDGDLLTDKVIADAYTLVVFALPFVPNVSIGSTSNAIQGCMYFFMLLGPFVSPILHAVTPRGPGRRIRLLISLGYSVFWIFRLMPVT